MTTNIKVFTFVRYVTRFFVDRFLDASKHRFHTDAGREPGVWCKKSHVYVTC